MNPAQIEEGLQSIHASMASVGMLPLPEGEVEPADILKPGIFTLEGTGVLLDPQEQAAADILHHETGQEAKDYPLTIENGFFFSEVFGSSVPVIEEYRAHILHTLALIKSELSETGVLPYTKIDTVGKAIQEIDAEFAHTKIGKELDAIHDHCGPNSDHQYRKMTLCRTTVPVQMGEDVVHFFFEKFLVVYAYLDENGVRRSTITPIHSHPYNHEVVYFVKHGPNSKAVEREYLPVDQAGVSLFLPEGGLNPNLVLPDGTLNLEELRVEFLQEETLLGTSTPVPLAPFNSELAFRSSASIYQTDGLFRPHQVTIHDDESVGGTHYFAFNNYWGPLARVIQYSDQGKPVIWSHKEWD